MPLDARLEAQKLKDLYKEDSRQQTFNLLLLGESGSGKTFITRTCRKPVHIDSFDPGGTKGVRDLINNDLIIADTRYESEDPMHPSMYSLWKSEFVKRVEGGYFDNIGTYVLDSATTWSESIMNHILKKAKIPGQAPRWAHDYVPQKVEIRNRIRTMLDLPCDFIMTGHLKALEEAAGEHKSVEYRFMTTGQGMVVIPLLFDEIWVLRPIGTGEGSVKYRVMLKSTGKFLARSRLASDGKLDGLIEEPNMKKILKQVGLPTADKPLLK